MKRTGVFATTEEAQAIDIADRLHDPLLPPAQVMIHTCALQHGLPEIPGYYGIDLKNREFLRS